MKRYIIPRFVVICGCSILLGAGLTHVLEKEPARAVAQAETPVGLDEFSPEERIHISVYEQTNRSVVNIDTLMARQDPFFMFQVDPVQGAGSGSVLDKEGHILTNNHVVKDAQQILVTLFTGESFPAELVGVDPDNDVAVLRIDAPPELLHPLPRGDSSRLRVGQKVFAIGNPFGLERTLTVGIISNLQRTMKAPNGRRMKSMIQIDAALNAGNSGGPLINSHGRLIGMNTAIASPSNSGENTGVGFAIPVNVLSRVVPELIRNGHVVRPDMGVARVFPVKNGLQIVMVTPGGPAEQAGLNGFRIIRETHRRGGMIVEQRRIDRELADTILAVDGQPVRTVDELLDTVEEKAPGEKVVLTIKRQGATIEVPLILGGS